MILGMSERGEANEGFRVENPIKILEQLDGQGRLSYGLLPSPFSATNLYFNDYRILSSSNHEAVLKIGNFKDRYTDLLKQLSFKSAGLVSV